MDADLDTGVTISDILDLADWRRQMAELYVQVRALHAARPEAAWELWRARRETLIREHPQSPVPPGSRRAFRARHYPFDPDLVFEVEVRPAPPSGVSPGPMTLPASAGEAMAFAKVGSVDVPFRAGTRTLGLYWLAGYAGGLFLPFRDGTSGRGTYGAGRYVIDGAKSADLGWAPGTTQLVLDFNFAYHPSCAFDPRWACPLAPRENWLDIEVEGGERLE